MSDNSPRLDLPYIQGAQAQKHVTHNEALRLLDVLVQLSVVGFDEITPPSLPVEGAVYALGVGATDDWAGHDGDLAVFVDGYWQFHTPTPGTIASEAGTSIVRVWTGSAWKEAGAVSFETLPGVGVNTASDTTNRLAVSSPATLLTHEGAGHRLKINKAAGSETASLLFQDNWSGRAEMGLAGDDDFHIRVSADGSNWADALTIDRATGKTALAQADVDGLDLAAIDAQIAATAVDVVVYDTSRDSDGGAWRFRCQHTSWHNEPLNTATRGGRREFPAVAVIVAETDSVTIYDADDPALPMWRVTNRVGPGGVSFWRSGVGEAKIIVAGDGKVLFVVNVASPTSNQGILGIDFAADTLFRYSGAALSGGTGLPVSEDASTTATFPNKYSEFLSSPNSNDVALTALPNAPINPATGLPVPTIAAATDGGVSVINTDGTVTNSSATLAMGQVGFQPDGSLWYARNAADFHAYYATAAEYQAGGAFGTAVAASQAGLEEFDLLTPASEMVAGTGLIAFAGAAASGDAVAGLMLHKPNPAQFSKGLSALVTSSYNTGWLPGDIKGAFLSDTDDTDLVGGTDAVHPVNATNLTVNGTITRTPVATGAELVAYCGFSTTNYLEQPYNSDLDFGSGDFCVMGWVKGQRSAYNCFLHRNSDKSNATGLRFMDNGAGQILVTGYGADLTGGVYPVDDWFHACFVRKSSVGSTYVNGRLAVSGPWAVNVNDIGSTVSIGGYWSGNQLLASAPPLTLWRISATAPTAEQIIQIYEDEKALFQENAACTLHGGSDAVTAIAHDPVTDILHAGTDQGRFEFSGLRRVAQSDTGGAAAISAMGGMVAS